MTTRERYIAVDAELAQVCESAGRKRREVTLVAVSKTVGPEDVALAIEGGACDFGENRPDQLMGKADRFTDAIWHFIGNIQSRRIRDIVGRAALVHSLYQERHARKIDEIARERGIVQDVLLEVNVSGEQSKSGLAPEGVKALLDACASLPNVKVRGLMTMAPQGDLEVARKTFAGLRELRDALQGDYPDLTELSMGMTDDWREAVAEGTTIIRVGRAIFSEQF
ncbi:MAG: YggS family pyridoxal phosphate-dependent enzyme [Eggerthellaceae bacterium]|nr:YggS family pyridoxal phosphate-dependent enzyme [Eggerthellaceae bacterium]